MLSQSKPSTSSRHTTIGYVVLAISAFLSMASLSSAASAAESLYIFPRAHFTLKGTHGYTATVDGWSSKVRLTLTRGLASIEYEGPGRFRNGMLTAQFSTYGKIVVAFKSSGQVNRVRPPPRCKGRAVQEKSGTFVGTIGMRGAHGFTVVNSRKARGTVLSGGWHCRKQSAFVPTLPPQPDGKLVMLTSSQVNDNSARRFGVLAPAADPFPELSVFFAELTQYARPLHIRYFAMAFGRISDFSFAQDLSGATVAPPLPFHGATIFGRNPDYVFAASKHIRVDFPGAENVRMVGPEFLAELKYVKLPITSL